MRYRIALFSILVVFFGLCILIADYIGFELKKQMYVNINYGYDFRYIPMKDSIYKKSALNDMFIDNIARQRSTDNFKVHLFDMDYSIFEWEIFDLKNLNIKDVSINIKKNYSNKLDFYYNLYRDDNPEVHIAHRLEFKTKKININLDEKSKILKFYESSNYKGFFGIVNKMSISNSNNENYATFDYKFGQRNTILIVYKTINSFYIIHFRPPGYEKIGEELQENIINILNLK